MGTITEFTVPLVEELPWCLELTNDQLWEESFQGLFWMHWSLVQGNLEVELWIWWYIQKIQPFLSTFLARISPIAIARKFYPSLAPSWPRYPCHCQVGLGLP